jgi:hypothetical protein
MQILKQGVESMRICSRFLSVICLSTIVASCGGALNRRNISSSTFPGEWMLTVNSGELICESPSAVVFTAPDGGKYAVNGTAEGKGYNNIRPIWKDNPQIQGTKISIAPLIDEGLKLCQ